MRHCRTPKCTIFYNANNNKVSLYISFAWVNGVIAADSLRIAALKRERYGEGWIIGRLWQVHELCVYFIIILIKLDTTFLSCI